MLLRAALAASLAVVVGAVPHAAVKGQVSQLRDHYDFIVAGGGTSGLTVADRLSEAFPNSELPHRRNFALPFFLFFFLLLWNEYCPSRTPD